jgi:hypothetical protein
MRHDKERVAARRRATVATASEWSALGDVLPSQASSAVHRTEPPATPRVGATAEDKEAEEVVRLMKKSRSYDELPTDVTTERGIRAIFDRMDLDGSGTLSRTELQHGRTLTRRFNGPNFERAGSTNLTFSRRVWQR